MIMLGIKDVDIDEKQIYAGLGKLADSGWILIDTAGYISINPLLSDTIFEKLQPNLASTSIKEFITPILKPVKDIRNLYLEQIVALKPFVDQLMKRATSSINIDWDVLNELREYYIAVFDIPKVKMLTEIMEGEFSKYNNQFKPDFVENAIYRQGIRRFNLEDFGEAHKHFDRALNLLEQKLITIEKDIARISAYEGSWYFTAKCNK